MSVPAFSTTEMRKTVLRLYKEVNAKSAEIALQRSEIDRECFEHKMTLDTLNRQCHGYDNELEGLRYGIGEAQKDLDCMESLKQEIAQVQAQRQAIFQRKNACDTKVRDNKLHRENTISELRKKLDVSTHNISDADCSVESLRSQLLSCTGPRLSMLQNAESAALQEAVDIKDSSAALDAQVSAATHRVNTLTTSTALLQKELSTQVESLRRIRTRNETISSMKADIESSVKTVTEYVSMVGRKYKECKLQYSSVQSVLEPLASLRLDVPEVSVDVTADALQQQEGNETDVSFGSKDRESTRSPSLSRPGAEKSGIFGGDENSNPVGLHSDLMMVADRSIELCIGPDTTTSTNQYQHHRRMEVDNEDDDYPLLAPMQPVVVDMFDDPLMDQSIMLVS